MKTTRFAFASLLMVLPIAVGCSDDANDARPAPGLNVQVDRGRAPDIDVQTPNVNVNVDRTPGGAPDVNVTVPAK